MKLRTQLLLGYALVLVLMIVMGILGGQSSGSLLASQEWIAHTHNVMANGYLAQGSLVGMQTAKRGFFLSGSDSELQRYEQDRKRLADALKELRLLVSDNPVQQGHLVDISVLVERWVSASAGEIEERVKVSEGSTRMEDFLQMIRGKIVEGQTFDEILDRISAFLGIEREILAQRNEAAAEAIRWDNTVVFGVTGLFLIVGTGVMLYVSRRVSQEIGGEPAEIAFATKQIAQGNLDVTIAGNSGIAASVGRITATLKEVARQANSVAGGNYNDDVVPRSEVDELGIALRAMTTALRKARTETDAREWLKTGLARLSEAMQGDPDIDVLAAKAVREVATWLDAKVGALYVLQEDGVLALLGSYAYVQRKNLSSRFRLGEGLVGQAALEKQQILIRNAPEDYIRVTSGLGELVPRFICVTPFSHEDRLKGVLEFGTLNDVTPLQLDYLQQAMPALAVAVESAHARKRLESLLAESRQLTEELQAQQEELRLANEELEEQTQRLLHSEERLKAQQEELQVSNEELEAKTDLLERQKQEVEQARRELSVKADELALASKYKSEFLANMSHELRTPLNSLLLLAQSLAQNKNGNLSDEQVNSARIIHSSGSDLLSLINDILDLSKIEAGRMDLNLGEVAIADLADGLQATFRHMASDRGLSLETVIADEAPAEIATDRKRLDQILRNLLSNALKFTERGGIAVKFARPALEDGRSKDGQPMEYALAIAVQDTGIGIPADKHRLIFEAFQQSDGSTTRKYGGTGLGLTISRELAALLGGEIQLDSTPGQGSTFTLYLPLRAKAAARTATRAPFAATQSAGTEAKAPASEPPPFISDDRGDLSASDWLIQVIEDDSRFAAILRDQCHSKGFKCVVAPSGEAGLELIARHPPKGVILDLRLPGMDGMGVLAALKENTRTRHIPVHIISVDEHGIESLRRGAVGHAVKPLDQEHLDAVFSRLAEASGDQRKRVLVVEGDPKARRDTVQLIASADVQVDEAESGAAALQALRRSHYDCVVLDLTLPDMGGKEMLDRLEQEGVAPPVIVHAARSLSSGEEEELRERTDSIVVKDVRSSERLLDEVSLFLHRVVSQMPERQRRIIHALYDSDAVLQGKKVLVVDDDMRTTFALAKLLTEHGIQAEKAENGEHALHLLDEHPDTNLVLMDVMMPAMDGYEAMERIRAQDRFRTLPIIALTAKALPEDREKCLAAGASDYLSKPIDMARLLSMMRVWLHG